MVIIKYGVKRKFNSNSQSHFEILYTGGITYGISMNTILIAGNRHKSAATASVLQNWYRNLKLNYTSDEVNLEMVGNDISSSVYKYTTNIEGANSCSTQLANG